MKKLLNRVINLKLNQFSFRFLSFARFAFLLLFLFFYSKSSKSQVTQTSAIINGTTSVAFSGTPYSTILLTGANNSGTTITVTSTANLLPGAIVFVTSGTGSFPPNTTIVSVTDGTTFVTSAAPTTALASATISAVSPLIAGATSWTPPVGVNTIQVEAWGGGGGTSTSTSRHPAGGGAGGSYVRNVNYNVSNGTTYLINVGNGGVGGSPATTSTLQNTTNGYNGGISYFRPTGSNITTGLVAALGGAGAAGGVNVTPIVGGSGSGGVNNGSGIVTTYSGIIYTVTNGGSGYTTAPTVTIGASLNSGFGSGSTRTYANGATYNEGEILFVGNNVYKVTAAGTTASATAPANVFGDYIQGATFTYVGVRASATAIISNGVVTGLIVKDGSGYTSIPAITFTGGGGSGASATATLITSNYPTTAATSFMGGTGGTGWINPAVPVNYSANKSGGGGSSAGSASDGNMGGGDGIGGATATYAMGIGPKGGIGVQDGGGDGATGVGQTTSGVYAILSASQYSGGGSGGVSNGAAGAEAGGGGAAGKVLITYTLPTLSDASLVASAVPGSPATIHLNGLVANSTNNTIEYTINGIAQTPVTGVDADGNGSANFMTTTLTAANIGQTLQITKITNSFNNFSTFTQNVILPVALTTFSGAIKNNTSVLSWTTASETNNKGFMVQRSADNVTWEDLSFINGKGSASTYSYVDVNPLGGNNYYRLKQIDVDGKATLSAIVALNFAKTSATTLSIYPNPASNYLRVQLGTITNSNAVAELIALDGKIVATKILTSAMSGHEIIFDVTTLKRGFYALSVKDGKTILTEKIIVN